MKRHLSHVCRLFAFFLVFLMVLAPMMTPATAVAETETSASERETGSPSGSSSGLLPDDLPEWETEPNPDYEPGGEAFRAMEIPTRRERYVKHFALGGGEYQAVVYGDAVHRLNADGTWRDIDNRLLSDGAGRFATPDGRVQVAGNTGRSDFLLSIEENGYYIAMTPYDSGAVTAVPGLAGELLDSAAEIVNHPERVTADTDDLDALMTVNNTTCVTYSSVYRATDLEYILTGDTIKENIIVNAPADSYTYVFRIRLSGLYPVLSETGEIRLLDEGTDEERYVMPAPFMYDADGDYSDEVSYRILETEEAGQYLLAVVADENWFSERDRAFPVTIDPSIQTNVTADTFLDKNSPDSNYNSADCLWVGSKTTVFMKMPSPSLPSGSTLISAYLYVNCYYIDHVVSNELTIGAYQITKAWTPSTVTWNSANRNTNLGMSTTRLSSAVLAGNKGYYLNSPCRCSFNIKSAVSSWLSGTSNYGIALKYEGGTNESACIRSLESGGGKGAYYTVTYRQAVLANGVYYLKHPASGKYLDTKDGGYTDGSTLQAWTKTDGVNRNQLYKITYAGAIGVNNVYTIRPMTNCELGLYYDEMEKNGAENSIFLKKMLSAYDQTVFRERQDGYLWILAESSGTYTIKNITTVPTNHLCMAVNSGNGTPIIPSGGGANTARWVPEAYTEELNGFDWHSGIDRLLIGESAVYFGVMYDSVAGRNGPVTYSVTDGNNNVTDRADFNSTTGKLIAKKAGQVKVRATYPGAKWIFNYYLRIFEAIEGTYYIQNKQHSKYLQPQPSDKVTMELWDFDGEGDQRWEVLYVSYGYYKIISVASGKAVSVSAGYEGTDNYKLVMEDYSEDNERQLWEFVESSRGNYIIRPKCRFSVSTDYCMAAGNFIGIVGNGLNVNQRVYVEDNDLRDEWRLELLDDYKFTFYGITNFGHDHSSALASVLTELHNRTEFNNITLKKGAIGSSECNADLKNTKVFTSRSHGKHASDGTSTLYTGIVLNDLDGSNMTCFASHSYSSMTASSTYIHSTDRYDNLELVLFIGCGTACGGEGARNLPTRIVEQGAQTAIGFTASINCDQANEWTKDFYNLLLQGETVQSAATKLNHEYSEDSGMRSWVICGDENYKLVP